MKRFLATVGTIMVGVMVCVVVAFMYVQSLVAPENRKIPLTPATNDIEAKEI